MDTLSQYKRDLYSLVKDYKNLNKKYDHLNSIFTEDTDKYQQEISDKNVQNKELYEKNRDLKVHIKFLEKELVTLKGM